MREALRRPHHRAIAGILHALDGAFLLRSRCFFGGGTLIALRYGEYRESRDIDFLCSDRDGFRVLRETVRADGLGSIARTKLTLAREVRADRDGIRTFVEGPGAVIKLEIILEARIDLEGAMDRALGVPALGAQSLAAEKILANADRGLDDATRSRDLIDLAFLCAREGAAPLEAGLAIATKAYGGAAIRGLRNGLRHLQSRGKMAACTKALGITDPRPLRKGLTLLRRIASS